MFAFQTEIVALNEERSHVSWHFKFPTDAFLQSGLHLPHSHMSSPSILSEDPTKKTI